MLDKFQDLWQVLSKPGVEQKKLYAKLIGNRLPELPPKLSASIVGYPGIVNRNVFQTDLQIVSELVIEDLARSHELETEFLATCYCQSGALSQYSLTSRSILQARYAALFDSDMPRPTTVPAVNKGGISPELLSESFSRRPILLIGDVGVGKTSFIRHLIYVDAKTVFKKAITLYIDLGSQANFSDLKTFLPEEIARQLREDYQVDIEERNVVRGIYHSDLQRFSKGIYSDLKETNPSSYKEKEIDFLEKKLQNKEQHLKSALEHLREAQKKQIVVFLDNSDQRDDSTQQQTFLMAQEIADHWPVLVFVALRPETYYRSLKIGALSGYHPKAFTISPPRVDLVIEKRLEFALKLTSGEIPIQALHTHVQIQLTTMDKIIHIFLASLEYDRALKEFIDNISGGNIRLALDLVKGFFGSGHVDTQKIVNKYDETGTYFVPLHEFLRAVIYGDSRYYEPDRSPIANIFDLSHLDPKEHFLLPLLIGMLASSNDPSVEEGFVEISKVYEQLQGLGFTPNQIDLAIVRGHTKKLIETGARRVPQPGSIMPQALRATTIGLYHIHRLCHQFTYIDAIVVDTPILNNKHKTILNVHTILDRLDRADLFRLYLDEQWSAFAGANTKTAFDWNIVSTALKRDIQYIRPRAIGASY